MQSGKITFNLLRDIAIIALSIIIAIILAENGIIDIILLKTGDMLFLGNFVAGMFFTSIFTTAPATVALGIMAQSAPNVLIAALPGALGAVIGDLVIFRFLRDSLGKDIIDLITQRRSRRLRAVFKLKFLRSLMSFIGALVIASPLPDELGLMMMGISKLETRLFIPLSFALNFTGIVIISVIARSLL